MNKLIVGNWKMHGGRPELAQFAALGPEVARLRRVEIVVCPPAVWLTEAAHALAGAALQLGAQDCSAQSGTGPFTGEISAEMLAEAGAKWVIIGHSERRSACGECDALVRAKAMAARGAGLQPIVCVGESSAQRLRGEAEAVVTSQARSLQWPEGAPLSIAYEPLWAIGAGITPSANEISRIAALLRREVPAASEVRLLYGGSVKPDNTGALLAAEGVDGLLVGAASLDQGSFLAICRAAQGALERR